MSIKTYMLYCEYCNYKRITKGNDIQDLYKIKTSPIPGATKIEKDPETDKIIRGNPINQPKKFRCPQCGKVVIPKKISDPQAELIEKLETEERIKRLNEEKNKFNGSETSPS